MPYTAPEGFFEEAGNRALAAASKIRRIRRRMIMGGAAAAVIILAAVPFYSIHQNDVDHYASAAETDEEILELYEYDIFLKNF